MVAAVNAQGGDGRIYTLMMLADGGVVARRAGKNENGNPFHRFYIRRRTGEQFRDLETLVYIAEGKGFTPISASG